METMDDIIRCKDCKYFEHWRSNPEVVEKCGQLYDCGLLVLTCPSLDDYCSKAEKKEQKFGKWIETDSDDACWYMCSVCHRRTDEKSNYCPNCGRKMVDSRESEERE